MSAIGRKRTLEALLFDQTVKTSQCPLTTQSGHLEICNSNATAAQKGEILSKDSVELENGIEPSTRGFSVDRVTDSLIESMS